MSGKFTEKAESVLNHSITLAEGFGHTYIGTEHLLLALSGEEETYAAILLVKHKLNAEFIKKSIEEYSGFGEKTSLSSRDTTPRCRKIIEDSYKIAQKYNSDKIGTEHLLYSILEEKDSVAGRMITKANANTQVLKEELLGYIRLSQREFIKVLEYSELNIPNLTKYGCNMTKSASKGEYDPVIGRDTETDRIIRILSRKRKNNPCLIGEAGVGKTAIIEGLADRISKGNVPASMIGKTIISLDLSSMVAGAKYRGDFEERIKSVLDEASKNKSVILFIDEIHSIVGAGSAEGAIDASNIMKPELARGNIQLIGATTLSEYRKFIEKDAAVERRFQPVYVEEPKREETVNILFGIKKKYEEHHKIKIEDSAIYSAVDMSCRYLADRRLPDKAIDLLDEACAMATITQINASFSKTLDVIPRQNALCAPEVSSKTIAEVVSEIVGYSVENTESEKYENLSLNLNRTIIGQSEGVKKLSLAIKRSQSALSDERKPKGIFLLVGESGVGKTETAYALAKELFGSREALIRFDMSEYSEPYSTSKLIGSAPGYVGYEDTDSPLNKIRYQPYSVILFDEIEKAHQNLHALLLQVFDNGILTDSKGRKINFRNSYIIMTANSSEDTGAGCEKIGFLSTESPTDVKANLKKVFKEEFLNRVDEIIPFSPLTKSALKEIADNKLKEIKERLYSKGFEIEFTEQITEYIVSKSTKERRNARSLLKVISSEIESALASLISNKGSEICKIEVTLKDSSLDFRILSSYIYK